MCFFMSAISPAGPLARPALAAFWERCAACSGECAQQYALSPRADKEQGVPSRLCPEHLGMTPTPLRCGLLWPFAAFVQSSSLLVSRLAVNGAFHDAPGPSLCCRTLISQAASSLKRTSRRRSSSRACASPRMTLSDSCRRLSSMLNTSSRALRTSSWSSVLTPGSALAQDPPNIDNSRATQKPSPTSTSAPRKSRPRWIHYGGVRGESSSRPARAYNRSSGHHLRRRGEKA